MSHPEDIRLRENINAVKDSGEKAASLTRQLLAFSRKQVLNVHSLDLNVVVEGMVKNESCSGSGVFLFYWLAAATMALVSRLRSFDSIMYGGIM